MFGSHVEMKMKANSVSQAKDLASVLEPEIRSLGLNQSLLRDKWNDEALVIATYQTAAEQEAAAAGGKEILGKYAGMFLAPPSRRMVDIINNFQ